ncbi:hypothetical protein Tco_1565561, partial [Tanacetum coccineum]
YVVPTGRVVVPTGRYVVPAGKVIIIVSPGRLSLVLIGRVLSPGSKDLSRVGSNNDKNDKESWALLEDLALYDNESWNDPRDFAKPVKDQKKARHTSLKLTPMWFPLLLNHKTLINHCGKLLSHSKESTRSHIQGNSSLVLKPACKNTWLHTRKE